MTRFVGIGDVHEHPGPRNEDRLHSLDQIITEGSKLDRLGAWIVAGDLFHARSTAEGRNAWDARLQVMAALAPVVVVYGNHDESGDLDGFARLKAAWPIYVFDRPQVAAIPLATGQAASVFVLPYPHRAGLVGAGITPQDVVSTAADLLDPIFIEAAHALAQARQQGDLTLMVGHVNVSGAIASTGQPQIGREIELSPRHLERLGPIAKLLGHVHRPQEIAGAIYIGSVCRLDFGECEEKRWIEVRLDSSSHWDVISHPIAIAPMFHIDGVLTRDGFTVDSRDESNDEVIHRRLAERDWAGCDVRVRVSYRASEKTALIFGVVDEIFAGALRLKVETIAIPDRDVRQPEVAAATTLPAKLAAYRKEETLAPAIASKVDALLQQTPEQLLADVAANLSTIEAIARVTVAA